MLRRGWVGGDDCDVRVIVFGCVIARGQCSNTDTLRDGVWQL